MKIQSRIQIHRAFVLMMNISLASCCVFVSAQEDTPIHSNTVNREDLNQPANKTVRPEVARLLNCLNSLDRQELAALAEPDNFANHKATGETAGWVPEILEALKELGAEVNWDSTSRQYRITKDVAEETQLHVELQQYENGELVIKLTNISKTESLWLLKPMDGSFHFRHVMPQYSFEISNENDASFNRIPACKTGAGSPYSDTNWPDDYLIELKPGASYSPPIFLPYAITTAGEFDLTFEYAFEPESETTPYGNHKYPKQLWKGRATSNTFKASLESNTSDK